jgi:hypothetical protein
MSIKSGCSFFADMADKTDVIAETVTLCRQFCLASHRAVTHTEQQEIRIAVAQQSAGVNHIEESLFGDEAANEQEQRRVLGKAPAPQESSAILTSNDRDYVPYVKQLRRGSTRVHQTIDFLQGEKTDTGNGLEQDSPENSPNRVPGGEQLIMRAVHFQKQLVA